MSRSPYHTLDIWLNLNRIQYLTSTLEWKVNGLNTSCLHFTFGFLDQSGTYVKFARLYKMGSQPRLSKKVNLMEITHPAKVRRQMYTSESFHGMYALVQGENHCKKTIYRTAWFHYFANFDCILFDALLTDMAHCFCTSKKGIGLSGYRSAWAC